MKWISHQYFRCGACYLVSKTSQNLVKNGSVGLPC